MKNYKINSNAKLNLFLNVENKRIDGFHNIKSLFIELDYCDTIIFQKAKKFELKVKGIKVPDDQTNLIYKTYHLLRKSTKKIFQHYSIILDKKIPIYSGLGGGSSNAAQTLIALNKLWKLNLNEDKLQKKGLQIGSDVPFFIRGGLQYVEGRGGQLVSLKIPQEKFFYYLLICPGIKISTKWAYEKIKNYLHTNKKQYNFDASFKSFNWLKYKNDFEELIISTYPEIGEIKKKLITTGAFFTSLSGSGSTMFGVYENKELANKARKRFSSYHTIVTFPKNKI